MAGVFAYFLMLGGALGVAVALFFALRTIKII